MTTPQFTSWTCRCGSRMPPHAAFCGNCGAPFLSGAAQRSGFAAIPLSRALATLFLLAGALLIPFACAYFVSTGLLPLPSLAGLGSPAPRRQTEVIITASSGIRFQGMIIVVQPNNVATSQSIRGSGTVVYSYPRNFAVTVTVLKPESSGKLIVEVRRDGELLGWSSTDDYYGTATVATN